MKNTVKQPQLSDNFLGLVLGLIGVLIFSGTLPATRIAIGSFDPWFVTFGRAAMATLAAIAVLGFRWRPLPRDHLTTLFLIGLLLVFGFPGFMAVTIPTAFHGTST